MEVVLFLSAGRTAGAVLRRVWSIPPKGFCCCRQRKVYASENI
ncbi:unnamed protein product [Tuber melanosporum]|uniref:(Perigord truffle) hypothetical protein n=1 Tax=Tuber melanosporum (strain Mel28) TaxID=656061 RepID=D5GA88_TUBMM|nr:uncharacterized protein GSTUM_00005183001 [Tuber melanosporum]CAZ81442.1 unnamed protein product [Tuber melanosporum]